MKIGTLVRPKKGSDLVKDRLLKVCHCWGKGWQGEDVWELTFPDADLSKPHALYGPFLTSELKIV